MLSRPSSMLENLTKKLKTLNLHIYFAVVCNQDKIGVLSQSPFQKGKRNIAIWEAKMTIFNYFNSMKIQSQEAKTVSHYHLFGPKINSSVTMTLTTKPSETPKMRQSRTRG